MASEAQRAENTVIVNIIGCTVLLLMVVGTAILVWQGFLPTGATSTQRERTEEIFNHYDAGHYDQVIAAYERPFDIAFTPWVNWQKMTGLWLWTHEKMFVQVGHAYEQAGDIEAAERQYLLALGWDADEYRSDCREAGDCLALSTLRTVAESSLKFGDANVGGSRLQLFGD